MFQSFASAARRLALPALLLALAATPAARAQNVGVGTLTPGQKLDVVGGNVRISTTGNGLIFPDGTTQTTASFGATQNLQLNNNWLSNDGGNEGLRVDNTGRVGIGTGSPLGLLSITPNDPGVKISLYDGGDANNHLGFGVSASQLNYHVFNASNDHVFYAGGKSGPSAAATELFRVKGNGNVGIGINPTSRLHVLSANNTAVTNIASFLANNATAGVAIGWGGLRATGSNASNDLTLDSKGAGDLLLQTDGGTGNVGIGTGSPTSKLQVAGSFSLPHRTIGQTTPTPVTINATDYTVRSGTSYGGPAVFSFYLPDAADYPGRVLVLLNSGNTPANLYVGAGNSTTSVYDDGGTGNLTQIAGRSRLTVQSNGSGWLVLSR